MRWMLAIGATMNAAARVSHSDRFVTTGPTHAATANMTPRFHSIPLSIFLTQTLQLRELARIVKPGGRIYISFGPLFNSAFGLHAYRTVFLPYPQFLLTKETLQHFIDDLGIRDLGGARTEFQFVNAWGTRQYQNLFHSIVDRLHVDFIEYSCDMSHLDIVYKYRQAFFGRGLSFEELTTNHIVACFTVL